MTKPSLEDQLDEILGWLAYGRMIPVEPDGHPEPEQVSVEEAKQAILELFYANMREVAEALKACSDNDKTEYNYHGKSKLNRNGKEPGVGKRFSTPKEIADAMLASLGAV